MEDIVETIKHHLPKAVLLKPELGLNENGYVGLFTARGEMIRANSDSFIKGSIDYTHVLCWKVPYDEPFFGVNGVELKDELESKIVGGFLKEDGRGDSLEDPSMLNLITADVSIWARDVIMEKDVNYFVRDFCEVYDFKYSVSARLANTAVYLEVSYI